MIDFGQMNRRDEDHRDLLEARMFADHRGQLETVDLRHAHIHQDERDLILEQAFQSLLAGLRLDEIVTQLTQDDLIGQQLRRLIVDQKNVDLVVRRHMHRFYRCSHIRNAESNCSVLTGFAR